MLQSRHHGSHDIAIAVVNGRPVSSKYQIYVYSHLTPLCSERESSNQTLQHLALNISIVDAEVLNTKVLHLGAHKQVIDNVARTTTASEPTRMQPFLHTRLGGPSIKCGQEDRHANAKWEFKRLPPRLRSEEREDRPNDGRRLRCHPTLADPSQQCCGKIATRQRISAKNCVKLPLQITRMLCQERDRARSSLKVTEGGVQVHQAGTPPPCREGR